jgi:hypothetical protein
VPSQYSDDTLFFSNLLVKVLREDVYGGLLRTSVHFEDTLDLTHLLAPGCLAPLCVIHLGNKIYMLKIIFRESECPEVASYKRRPDLVVSFEIIPS